MINETNLSHEQVKILKQVKQASKENFNHKEIIFTSI